MEDNFDLTNLKSDKKKRTNSKAKGSRFERKIATIFNDKFNTKDFSRTPGSGAFATTHSLPEHLQLHGDLITPKNFKYCIECKKGYKNVKINNLLDYSSQLWKFIYQSEKDSEKCRKEPMILFQQDRQPILAIARDKWFYGCHDTEGDTEYIKFGKYQSTKYMIVSFEKILEKWTIQDWFDPDPDAGCFKYGYLPSHLQ